MSWKVKFTVVLVLALSIFITSCTYNPFVSDNRPTGSPVAAVVGAGIGAGSIGLLGGSRPMMVAGGLTGGFLGYYLTTLRSDAGPLIQAGGKVYTVGDFVGIYIPTDRIFVPNTDELLPQAAPILDSVAVILQRYPNNSILISGNTSGFGRPRWEQRLSERRAAKVAAYLWNAGINSFKGLDINTRKLNYVGYGDYFPISQSYTNKGIRQNSRIQITSYPTGCDIGLSKGKIAMYNVGADNDKEILQAPTCSGEDC